MEFLFHGFLQAIKLLISFNPETYSAIYTTIIVSTYSMIASLIIGIPLGFLLGYFDFKFKRPIRIIVDTLLALPTVFIGLMIYSLLTYNGPFGSFGLLFSVSAIAIGQTILALPIVIALTATTIEAADENLRVTLISLGANRMQLLLSSLWEARFGILTAAATAYGRVLTEVGISMMVGGNIKWHTRTITTAIALETNKGQFELGIALGIVLITIALIVNFSVSFLRKR